jgi:hypothetical protein
MLAISLVIIGLILRFLPHPANFTPVAAIALFSGAYLGKRYAIIVPLALMAASDIFIGMHNVMLFTWGGFALSGMLGLSLRKTRTIPKVALFSLSSSVIFYLVSNFGVWFMGWYPPTLKGLLTSYIMGLPFLRDFTLATLLYSAVFFGAYELIARWARETKLAKVLL